MSRLLWSLLPCAAGLCAQALAPLDGAPAGLGGEVRLEQRGDYLWLHARIHEPGGKVLARSIGVNPVWEKDHDGSPPLEDRVQWRIRYRSAARGQRESVIEGNPWGAYRTEEGGEIASGLDVDRTAEVTNDGWTFEALLPLSTLNVDWTSPSIEWRAERIRSRRALAPEFHWQWPANSGFTKLQIAKSSSTPKPELRPLRLGNTDPPA